MFHRFRLSTAALATMFASAVQFAMAGSGQFIISTRGQVPKSLNAILSDVGHAAPPLAGDEWGLDDPAGFSSALLNLPGANLVALQAAHLDLIIELDTQIIVPASVPGPWLNWGLNSLLPSGRCSPSQGLWAVHPVWFNVVDTGIQKEMPTGALHSEFDGNSTVWGLGYLAPSLNGLFPTVSQLADPHNHGTSVASAAIGQQAGLMRRLPGAKIHLESFRIYSDNSPPTAWVSDAINAISNARVAHSNRRSIPNTNPYDDASALIFANRTNAGYSESVEAALARAAGAGMVVVCAAGNDNAGVPEVPSTVPSPPGSGPTSPRGLPVSHPSRPTASALIPQPISGYMLLAGSYDNPAATGGALSRSQFSNYGLAVDVMAPGSAVWLGNRGGTLSSFNGTSQAAGAVAGLALYFLSIRPQASAHEAYAWLLGQATAGGILVPPSQTGLPRTIPRLAFPCLEFTDWLTTAGIQNASETDDADHDGLSNVAEYALNTNPSKYTANPIQCIGTTSGPIVQITVPTGHLPCDFTLDLQFSTNLANWTSAEVPLLIPSLPGSRTIDFSPATSSRKFFRLAILRLP